MRRLATLGILALLASICVPAVAGCGPTKHETAAAPASPAPRVTVHRTPVPEVDRTRPRRRLLVPYGRAVAAVRLDDGRTVSGGFGHYDTASIVKVDILVTLLLQAQDAGRNLSADEQTVAAKMIENSDNDSATDLWTVIGGASGLDAANRRFGMTETQGGVGQYWGLTQTTAGDQLLLLRQVFGSHSLLTAESREFIRQLLSRVETDQRWGVSAASDGSYELKNGWLCRSTTDTWDVNSIGEVEFRGHEYLIAVLSKGSISEAAGINAVQSTAVSALRSF